MVRTGRKPSELVELLFEKVGSHYYDRIDTPLVAGKRKEYERNITESHPKTIGGLEVLGLGTEDGYKFSLADGGWLLIRFSGTEPVVRVYCETTESDRVKPILEDGMRIVGLQ
jgi:phosphomannomutase